ncbi:hypothetical protein ZWY2020_058574 [Hordeum vulgare]|nr:hypothetical protein ZWY2020_058574 [Hordeum vulgare]
MNTSQFMDKQILGLAASGAASSPPSGGGGGGQLFDLMGPNPQEDDVVESHGLHARRGASATEEVMVPSYDFNPSAPPLPRLPLHRLRRTRGRSTPMPRPQT